MLVPVLLLTVAVSFTGAIDYCGLFHPNAVCVTSCPSGNEVHRESFLCTNGECCKPPAGGVVTPPEPGTLIVDENTCGVTSSSRRKRAISGEPGAQCNWPWLVSIRIGFPDFPISVSHVMTGVLVSKDTVLVHKETFDSYAQAPPDLASSAGDVVVEAAVGEYYLDMKDDEQNVYSIDVNSATSEIGDFLRLTLSEEVTVDGCVRPACLADETESAQLDLAQCKLIGWGNMDTGTGGMTLAPVPLQQNVTFLQQDTCDDFLRFSSIQADGNLLCLDYEPIPNIAEGDKGNAIICPNANGQWFVKALLVQGNYGPEGRQSPSLILAEDVVPLVDQIRNVEF